MSVITTIEGDAEKVLSWLVKKVTGLQAVEPQVVAALGVLLGAVGTSIAAIAADAAAPSITLSAEAIADIKAVWPAITEFAASIGIKL